MKPHTYSPEGRGHRTLRELSHGPKRLFEIADAMPDRSPNGRKRKLWYLLDNMMGHGFVTYEWGCYGLTREGEEAFATLERGEPVEVWPRPTPSVRMFAEASP